jgi:hypothetical protein
VRTRRLPEARSATRPQTRRETIADRFTATNVADAQKDENPAARTEGTLKLTSACSTRT